MTIQWTPQNIFAAVVALGALLSLILALLSLASSSGLRRKFKRWKKIHSTADLEEVYSQTLNQVEELRQSLAQMESQLDSLEGKLHKKVSTAKMLRYNAFSDTGSDLSYSVALLDDEKNGVVLSSIYGREESRTYGKPIVSGESTYALTAEEEQLVQGREAQTVER
ncbi:DUF4446 family protein [Alicyclobacillus sp. SO9]|uniref:DUF4446 family protein n=1 Tax=Alicyclobacillus sp. SO9 TaxID=2665646 RepID=UPI0018E8D301|nr:DUF4446 family protein [Alicyclobacillus sp. SO9]QQE78944.1 DUF4446 family protein [Alicyclobacillus sp. SO9]